jgi:hypothetical protein
MIQSKYSIEMSDDGTYLKVIHKGNLRIFDMESARNDLHAVLPEISANNVLIDITEVKPFISFVEHLEFLSRAKAQLPDDTKIAAVVNIERFSDHMKYAEEVIEKVGLNMKIFDAEDQAIHWLSP